MSFSRETLTELDALDALARALPRASTLPPKSQCGVQADAVGRPEAVSVAPTGDVIEAVRSALRRGCEGGGAGSIPLRTLRDAPLALWNGDPEAASFPGLLKHFLFEAGSRARWLGPLIEAWLRDFGPDRIGLAETGRTIAARIRTADHPRLSVWRDAHEAFGLFDAGAGPRHVARALLNGPEPVRECLRRTGMDDPIRADGRYFRACVRALLEALPDALRGPSAEEAWSKASDILQVTRLIRDGQGRERSATVLRFADMAGPVAKACLGPWLGGAPPRMSRDPVKAFLVAMIGDPRLRPQSWVDAGDAATALMRRWLSEATLEAFFALISQRHDDAQWRYREKFWRACFDKRADVRVWVVLDRGLASWANTVPALKDAFGVMDGFGVQNQAVLLIKIGNLVLSEWSNVGPVRAWQEHDKLCPKMDQAHYEASALRAVCMDFPGIAGGGGSSGGKGLWHRQPEKYVWQQRAAALLEQRTGLRLSRGDYA